MVVLLIEFHKAFLFIGYDHTVVKMGKSVQAFVNIDVLTALFSIHFGM